MHCGSDSVPFALSWNPRLHFSPRFSFYFLFFFQPAIVDFVNCEQCICVLFMVPQITLFSIFLLKMGPTILFTHLKIISLQCFQFQFSVSAKISSIQTHPQHIHHAHSDNIIKKYTRSYEGNSNLFDCQH